MLTVPSLLALGTRNAAICCIIVWTWMPTVSVLQLWCICMWVVLSSLLRRLFASVSA